jgi:preprotein translocase subunit SecF
MLLALVLLGGQTIRWFVVALLIGTLAGTYSSTFIATPLLLVWKELEERKLWDLTRGKFRGIK